MNTKFNVIKVPLEDSNLIEASAGTGKTYSIAILVIRLLIEKKIELKEVLMVTFTKAAVAELEVRIRKFIREAYSYATYQTEIDPTIETIVDHGISQLSKEEVIAILNHARKQLDETSIFTIHSFCQKTLTEFAFETGQAFNCSVVEDESSLLNDVVNEYWRKYITILEVDLLTVLLKNGLSKSNLVNVVFKGKGDKKFLYETKHDVNFYKNRIDEGEKECINAIDKFHIAFETSPERTIENIGAKGYAFNAFSSLIDDAPAFRSGLIEKQDKGYVIKKFPVLLELALKTVEAENKLKAVVQKCLDYLYGEAISYCKNKIQQKKQEQSLFSFDDLINNLHQSISSPALNTALRKQYKAVFIDEFQDTDQKQYEIFNTFFNGHSILFYIGDPKQSIYSFKGTDIDTYLAARDSVKSSYTMNKNFRSTDEYNKAMNKLFTSVVNPFFDDRIDYEEVSAGKTIQELKLDDQVVEPLSLYQCDNQDLIKEETIRQVKDLLLSNYQIEGRRVKPSDIGILVRANRKANEIKVGLNRENIPAITIDDCKVLESEQSTLLLYLLKAMYEPQTSTINRVLLTYLTNKTKEDLLGGTTDTDLENFRKLNKIWADKGVFSAINTFIDLYNTLENIQINTSVDAERITTNVLQINEILHNKENQSKSSCKELIHWLELAKSGAEESSEYTQRLENDEDAVKIVTIHKSKGLAYNIVIAPYLDLDSKFNTRHPFIEYKDTELNQYCFTSDVSEKSLELYTQQTERENRRMIYVALTRAVYKGVIIHKSNKSRPNDGIKPFIDESITKNHFTFNKNLPLDIRQYKLGKTEVLKTPKLSNYKLLTNAWSNYSFSMLSKYEPHLIPASNQNVEDYDKFIFSEFPKGALAGNFLHYLFENIDFTSTDFNKIVTVALNRYQSVFNKKQENLDESIYSMLNQVLNAEIPASESFKLNEVKEEQKLPEMEFSFSMKGFSTKHLQELIPNINLAKEGAIAGMMTGFIDLLFEHNGQFYILDWKSNYLGNSLEYYTPEKLDAAMQESNYHLQYNIYAVATKLYLQNCLPNFDYNTQFGGVIYVYARGCRKDASSGIYFSKPEKEKVEALEKLLVD